MRPLLALLLLTACSHAPLSPAQRNAFDQVSAASFLGDSFTLDVSSRAMIRSREHVLDARAWKIDSTFAQLFGNEVKARGREFRAFALDEGAVKKALALRESRWQKTEAPVSQALLDQLFEAADREGIRYFFLLAPYREPERFALFRGVMGTACDDDAAGARAYAYFFAQFTFWDVAKRSKVFETNVNPSFTSGSTYGNCAAVAELTEPSVALEDPMKRTMAVLVSELFLKMGWAKP